MTDDVENPGKDIVEKLVLSMPIARALELKFVEVEQGRVKLSAPIRAPWTFRPRTVQATALFAMGDFAAVAAAFSVLPAGWLNATVDGQVKIFAPGRGDSLEATGTVIDDGRRTTICRADIWVRDGDDSTLCATWIGSAQKIPGSES